LPVSQSAVAARGVQDSPGEVAQHDDKFGEEAMMDVFLLWHVHELPDGEEDTKLIGVYSSKELAEQAQRRAGAQPGFRDAPTGFCISRYTIDQDHWMEGYVTLTHEDIMQRWKTENADQSAVADRPCE
jgi:hypothetical protein